MILRCRRPQFDSWVGKMFWRRDRLPTPVFLGFPGGSAGKESACNEETWIRSLGWEDSREKGKATHSRILAWRIPWTEESGKLQSMGSQRVRQDGATNTFITFMAHPNLFLASDIFLLPFSSINILLISYFIHIPFF